MKYEKPILKREVIKVFENECNLDNYELVALVDAFEDLRLLREESDPPPSGPATRCSTAR